MWISWLPLGIQFFLIIFLVIDTEIILLILLNVLTFLLSSLIVPINYTIYIYSSTFIIDYLENSIAE